MADKILVVDDEVEIVEEAFEALTEDGYDCRCANNVDDALKILRRDSEITLVVTDLKMPGKTGVDLIQESRKEFDHDIAFIVMSGHGSPTVNHDGINIDDYPFLRKPLDIGEFLELVRRTRNSGWRRSNRTRGRALRGQGISRLVPSTGCPAEEPRNS